MWHALVIPALEKLKQAFQGSLAQQASPLGSLAQAPDMVDSTNQSKENKSDKGDRQHLRNDPRGSGLHTQANIYEHMCVHTHILEHTKGFTEQEVEQCCPLG